MKEEEICPKCGNKITGGNNCLRCGYVKNSESIKEEIVISEEKSNIKQDVINTFYMFALSNILGGVPTVMMFGSIWLMFGAFGDKSTYYGVLIIIAIYLFVSAIAYFILLSKRGKDAFRKTKYDKYIIIAAIVISIFSHLTKGNNSNTKENQIISNNKEHSIMEEKLVYEDQHSRVKQMGIDYSKDGVKVSFTVDSFDNKYNCNKYDETVVRVNRYMLRYAASTITNDTNGICYFVLFNNKLSDFHIRDIYKVDIWLDLDGDSKQEIVTFESNSTKTDNAGDFEFLSDNKYRIYENNYFAVYYDPNFNNAINLLYISKIEDNYTLYIENEDADTFGNEGYASNKEPIPLYDYTVARRSFNYNPVIDNFSYYKADFKIVDEDSNIIKEGSINANFSKALVPKRK